SLALLCPVPPFRHCVGEERTRGNFHDGRFRIMDQHSTNELCRKAITGTRHNNAIDQDGSLTEEILAYHRRTIDLSEDRDGLSDRLSGDVCPWVGVCVQPSGNPCGIRINGRWRSDSLAALDLGVGYRLSPVLAFRNGFSEASLQTEAIT